MPDDVARLERDLEAFGIRLRALENLESPMLARALVEFRELQIEVRRIQEQGALETRGQLARIKDRLRTSEADILGLETEMKLTATTEELKDLKLLIKELSDDRKALVRIALAAVVAALLSLGVSLILRATGTG